MIKKIAALLLISFLSQCGQKFGSTDAQFEDIRSGFVIPSDENTLWCYWYWIGDDISKEGITKDLEAMKEAGIGAALIGNINPEEKDGKVPMLSDAWWDHMVHAINEGKRVGVDIGVFNCPGWSQSGGPWISSEMAMRYKVHTEVEVEGPAEVTISLPKPKKEFQDTYTVAFPEGEDIFTTNPSNTGISTIPALAGTNQWMDGDENTGPLFDVGNNNRYEILIRTKKPFSARNLSLTPGDTPFKCKCELEASTNGTFKTIADFNFERQKMTPNVGPYILGPLSISFPATVSDQFRLTCYDFEGFKGQVEKNTAAKAGFSEISLSSGLVLDRYIEKQMAKMHPTPFPTWESYLWKPQEAPGNQELAINKESVLDVSEHLDDQGVFRWTVPKGKWIVQRYGMTPTGTKNAPAAPQGKGYEVDKMSEELVRFHFEQFVGKLLEKVPQKNRSAFKYVIADSYEMGSQNWSDGFKDKFIQTYGYDPRPFLPVYSGRVIQSTEASERFLWDVRRLVADEVAYEYVGGLRKISNEHNLKLWLENYGHWGFPSEFLMYGGQSDLVSGEFWNEGTLGNIECKAASSAAHIYGKPMVSAEAFTAANRSYVRHPAILKKRGDWSYTEGINHFVLHLYIHQPDDSRVPGINAWFSTEFNRHNTWFEKSKAYFDYLRRCQHLLQQGTYVADLCYFIGENTPLMTGPVIPGVPKGYSYDFMNAEVILNDMKVEEGNLVLSNGMTYRMMILPPRETMRPELLKKIESLVADGAKIYGSAPKKSPSLENYPKADNEISQLAESMWKNISGSIKKYGDGVIFEGISLDSAIAYLDITKDLDTNGEFPVLWTHRSMPEMEIYFLTNQGNEKIEFSPSFRVQGMKPQLWNAITGDIRNLNDYKETASHITVPIRMEPGQSWFIVFSKNPNKQNDTSYKTNFPETKVVKKIDESWQVQFGNKDIGPGKTLEFDDLGDWTQSENGAIKYYSGTATYLTTFNFNKQKGANYMIDLGKVGVMASVKLNGRDIGTSWIAPFVLEVGDALKDGPNILRIEVVNLWRNRLTGDKNLPEDKKPTWVLVDAFNEDEALIPSGLMGPVTLKQVVE